MATDVNKDFTIRPAFLTWLFGLFSHKEIRAWVEDDAWVFAPDKIEDRLKALYASAMKHADDSAIWYCKRRRPKRWMSTTLRVLVIALFSVAALVPVLLAAGILHAGPQAAIDVSQSGYVAAALATALLGFDKFFGFSSGWIRFALTESTIRRAIAEFRMNWAMANTGLENDTEEKQTGKKRLQLMKEFLLKVSDLVDDETRQWAAEFQGSLATLEKSAKDMQDTSKPGAIEVTITRGKDVETNVELAIDGNATQVVTSPSFILTPVAPGLHKLEIRGKRTLGGASQPVEVQQAVLVATGVVAKAAVTLG